MPGGRPSDYSTEFAEQALKLCKLGATNAVLADFFQTTTQTINNWASAHQEFFDAIKVGKAEADDIVEKSLFQRAVGYTHDAVKIFMPANAAEPVYAPYREHLPPDPTSMIFWLKNRKPVEWRDRREISGPDGGPIQVSVSRFTGDEPVTIENDEAAQLLGSNHAER